MARSVSVAPLGPEGRIVDSDEYVATDQTVSVQVPLDADNPNAWDDNTRRQRIPGVFRADETYRLEIRLGRLRRNLSLKWTR